jgi:Flp pilus assembly protein TadG
MLTQDQPTHGRYGVAIVEVALILPVFLAFIGGIAEFGRAMCVTQILQDAARDGARVAAAGSTNEQVRRTVSDQVASGARISSGAVQVQITVAPAPGNPDPGNDVEKASPKDLVRVDVTVPGAQAAWLAGQFLGDVTLRGQSELRK